MNQREILLNISKIIERESKSTTYKFALLRGVVDIIKETPSARFHQTGKENGAYHHHHANETYRNVDHEHPLFNISIHSFRNEIQLSLLGKHSFGQWHNTAIEQLKNSCNYLINSRGYQAFEL